MEPSVISGNHFLTALMALGMAWAFLRADCESATTKALAVALAMTGLAIFARIITVKLMAAGPIPWWTGLLVIPGALGFIAAFEWTMRIRKMIPSGTLRTVAGDRSIRIAQLLIVVYAGAAVTNPESWVYDFLPGMTAAAQCTGQCRWWFQTPLAVAMVLWAASMLLCLNRRPDEAEHARLVALLLACPLIAAGLVLPLSLTPTATTLGLVVVLAGAMRHATLHGRRGLFLSRFLSPQVATLVNREGMGTTMREDCYPISVVSCDLRGFTAFADAHSSEQVLQLLREYYDTVGAGVVEVEGTIKDYAGDGVLILVGAPVPTEDHAARALKLAQYVRTHVGKMLETWSSEAQPLGVGIGVASGPVTVGVIGGEGRLEYAAVGQPVNLASRLCDQAGDREILIAAATIDLLDEQRKAMRLSRRPPLRLKGFSDPVATFELAHAQRLAQ